MNIGEFLLAVQNHSLEIGKRNIELAQKHGNKFYIGNLTITDGVQRKGFTIDSIELDEAFEKFINGDWGNTPVEDAEINNRSIESGYGDIMGDYMVDGVRIWIKTALCENTTTTILLPEEW